MSRPLVEILEAVARGELDPSAAFERLGNLFHEAGHSDLADSYFERAGNIRDRNSHALFF